MIQINVYSHDLKYCSEFLLTELDRRDHDAYVTLCDDALKLRGGLEVHKYLLEVASAEEAGLAISACVCDLICHEAKIPADKTIFPQDEGEYAMKVVDSMLAKLKKGRG